MTSVQSTDKTKQEKMQLLIENLRRYCDELIVNNALLTDEVRRLNGMLRDGKSREQ